MTPLTTLYIDTSKSARTALVRSETSNSPQQMNAVVAGDQLKMSLVFVENGAINPAVSGDNTFSMSAAIGTYSSGVLAKTTNFYVSSSYGFTGSLNLATGSLTSSLSGQEFINAIFEVEGLDAQGTRRTYLQTPVVVWNQVIT